MKVQSLKNWVNKTIVRDLSISKSAFIYLFVTLFSILLPLEVLIFKYGVSYYEGLMLDLKRAILVVSLGISFIISGSLVDRIKDKNKNFNIAFLICIAGFFLSNFTDTVFDYIGLACIASALPQMIVVWFTTLVHETNILNRGRITSLLLIICFFLGLIGVVFAFSTILYYFVFIIEAIVFLVVFVISKSYKYIETEERLQSNKKFREIVLEKHAFRYLTSLGILSFIVGNTVIRYTGDIDILTLALSSFFVLVLGGVLLDNVGRKFSLVGSILILSFFIIFSGLFNQDFVLGLPGPIFLSVFYGIAIPSVFLFLITISGDFSTDRGHLKYRGRINGLFTLIWFMSLIGGFIFHVELTNFYELDEIYYFWIPDFLDRLNGFLLVVLLVWMMAMKEFLTSKEVDWASTIRALYVFNYNGVCVYTRNFKPKPNRSEEISEDLISGGLTGIITLISEITENKKRLRIIHKEGAKIYFNYGKHHIAALISSTYLPVLFKKLDAFSSAFEKRFGDELANFHGRVNPFESAKYIVDKFFTQKYAIFTK